MQHYILKWDDNQIADVEAKLKDIHSFMFQFLKTIDENVSRSHIDMCGSFLTRTMVKSSPIDGVMPSVDLSITMPESFCSGKDVSDGQYFVKRHEFYKLMKDFIDREKEAFKDLSISSFTFLNSLTQPTKDSLTFFFENKSLYPIQVFARPMTTPGRVCSEKAVKKRTHYVNNVMEDAAMPFLLKLVHATCSSCASYMRAIIILKAWGFHTGLCGRKTTSDRASFSRQQIPPVSLAVLVHHLQVSCLISTNMTEENIVRVALVQLAHGIWDNAQQLMSGLEYPYLNFLHRTSSKFILNMVKPAAEEALKMPVPSDIFTNMPSQWLPAMFDVTLRLRFSECSTSAKVDQSADAADNLIHVWNKKARSVEEICETALSDRCSFLMVEMISSHEAILMIRLNNSSEGRSKLTKGPSIEAQSDVDKFVKFWGAENVTTRQFADGSIHKCVWWGIKCFENSHCNYTGIADPSQVILEPADVVSAIVYNVLKEKSDLTECNLFFKTIREVLTEDLAGLHVDTAPLVRTRFDAAVAEVTSIIKLSASGLACKVEGLDIVSASARDCEPFPIRPHSTLTDETDTDTLLSIVPCIEPIHCVLTIDDKHKIPDTLEAISTMKGALCAQLSKRLNEQSYLSYCTVNSVDFVWKGFLFRIYVAHYREVSLLRALGKGPHADMLERKLFWSAQHTKYITASFVRVYGSFSLAVRIAKRWVGAMVLGDFISPEAIELIVAFGYSSPIKPRGAPEGFYRFLELLATFQWLTEPLILDPTIVHDRADVSRWDKDHQGMWILTSYDIENISPFTQHTPRPMIVGRLSMLAQQALLQLDTGHQENIWTCNLSSFDFTLPLSKSAILFPDRCIIRDQTPFKVRRLWRKNDLCGEDQQRYITQLTELEPANFCLKSLRAVGREQCMIFMDIYGPSSLAVISLSGKPTHKKLNGIMRMLVKSAPAGSLETATVLSSKLGADSTDACNEISNTPSNGKVNSNEIKVEEAVVKDDNLKNKSSKKGTKKESSNKVKKAAIKTDLISTTNNKGGKRSRSISARSE